MDRDLVRFYARLTRTLEKHYGVEEVAAYLAGLRRDPDATVDAGRDVEPAVVRSLRRLGFVDSSDDMDLFVPTLIHTVSNAVTRSQTQVWGLIRALSLGFNDQDPKPVCAATPLCRDCRLTKECDYYNSPRKPEIAALPPSERLLSGPDEALADAELLAAVLFGEKGTGSEPLVRALLERYGRLRPIFNADPHEYAGMRDISRAQVVRLAAVSALYHRLLVEKRDEVLRVTVARDLYDRYAPELREYRIEAAVLVMMNQKNGVIRDIWFCDGASTVTHIGIAELLRPALREVAPRIALVHNHPSGDPTPSAADREFTRRLRAACGIVGLVLVDHVIVTESGFFSFAEEAVLDI